MKKIEERVACLEPDILGTNESSIQIGRSAIELGAIL
jgi:hypothetical protein